MAEECPVCFEPYPQRPRTEINLAVRSFQCQHALCRTCDGRMRERGDHRCPMCRAPRKGMTSDQAQPPRDLNAPSPEDFDDAGFHFQGFGDFGAGFTVGPVSYAAALNAGRRRLFPPPPPMWFPIVSHINIPPQAPLLPGLPDDPDDPEDPDDPDNDPANRGPHPPPDRRTLNPQLPEDLSRLVDDLCNLPGVSLSQWRRSRPRSSSSDVM